ncbi:MAG TPA: hypothetical protein VFX89_01280 [Gammaproteobacteria bacterium]|nr:hypothetical protein [Gammaproteobacteria bacterium]
MLKLGLLYCELGLLQAVASFPNFVAGILWRTALLGTLLCFVYEFVLRVPDFPFSSAILLPMGCATLFGLNRLLAVAFEPRSR